MKGTSFAIFLLIIISACSNNQGNHIKANHSAQNYFLAQAKEDTVQYGNNYRLKIYPKEVANADIELIGGLIYNAHLPKKGDTVYVEFTPTCLQQVNGKDVMVTEGVLERAVEYTILYRKDGIQDTLTATVPKKFCVDCNQPFSKK